MAEQESGQKKTGWFKAFVGTLAGLCSGAAVMYITPLVDKAIKPAKPVANFKVDHDGLTVRIQNLSNTGQGTWDFGDGSPLQPVGSENEVITHVYPGPGEYTVKLSAQNIITEENDRAVVVKLDGAAASAKGVKITKFEAVPMSTTTFAPVSYRLTSEVQDAQVCVWDLGDGKPVVEVMQDGVSTHEQNILLTTPGRHTIKLVAVSGKSRVEKSLTVAVTEPPPGVAKAVVSVIDAGGKRSEIRPGAQPRMLSARFPPQLKENVYKIETQALATMGGYTIADVNLRAGDKVLRLGTNTELVLDAAALGLKGARNLKLTLAADRKSLKLTGELVRDNPTAPPNLVLPVQLIEQREVESAATEVKLTRALGMPGSTFPSADTISLPPLPPGAAPASRQVRVELDDGATPLLVTQQLPASGATTVQGRRVMFNASRVNDQIKVSLTEPTTLPSPGN